MRMRKKPWADKEFEINTHLVTSPEENKGKWNEFFGNDNPVHIEIGCGKGRFLSTLAAQNPNINYIGIERQTQIIVLAMRKAREHDLKNLCFVNVDVKDLENYFAPSEISRIYINFCDPWPNKKKWAKKRLTHRNFLSIYERLFAESGDIHFKTDNKELFEFSLNEFSALADNGWRMSNISLDLHNSSFEGNIMTEYEEKFFNIGMPIYRLEAKYK
ncbi:MAG: tRNA (guanosine(46)-N7)-methyltransferase TrmB [Firmicutes bacterium]|nr:tRNA (guanosine(46)-N7)-methyltransferase TrmB [Bacillota bacterium]